LDVSSLLLPEIDVLLADQRKHRPKFLGFSFAAGFVIPGVVLVSAACLFAQSAGGQAAAPVTLPCSPIVEVAKAFAWPVMALIIAVAFRTPLVGFQGDW
jgi:hypothetical protein